ncbi:hypothetical protein HK101_006740 [Irineochytrium annulatum]|nr:hypothetical protein HK101_006740 [Irineochytrium annulatum]
MTTTDQDQGHAPAEGGGTHDGHHAAEGQPGEQRGATGEQQAANQEQKPQEVHGSAVGEQHVGAAADLPAAASHHHTPSDHGLGSDAPSSSVDHNATVPSTSGKTSARTSVTASEEKNAKEKKKGTLERPRSSTTLAEVPDENEAGRASSSNPAAAAGRPWRQVEGTDATLVDGAVVGGGEEDDEEGVKGGDDDDEEEEEDAFDTEGGREGGGFKYVYTEDGRKSFAVGGGRRMSDTDMAATRIQSMYRGFMARKMSNIYSSFNKNGSNANVTSSGALASSGAIVAAATEEGENDDEEAEDDVEEEEDGGLGPLQDNPKYKYVYTDGRKSFAVGGETDFAALRIQSVYRGFRARKMSNIYSSRRGSSNGPQIASEPDIVRDDPPASDKKTEAGAKYRYASTGPSNHGSNASVFDAAATRVQSAFRGFRVRKSSQIFVPPQIIKVDSEMEDTLARDVTSLTDLAHLGGNNLDLVIQEQGEDDSFVEGALVQPNKAGGNGRKSSYSSSRSIAGLYKTISRHSVDLTLSSQSILNLNESKAASKIQALFRGYQVRKEQDGDFHAGSVKVRESLDSIYKSHDGFIVEEGGGGLGGQPGDLRYLAEYSSVDPIDEAASGDENEKDDFDTMLSHPPGADHDLTEEEARVLLLGAGDSLLLDLDGDDDPDPETMDAISGKDVFLEKLIKLREAFVADPDAAADRIPVDEAAMGNVADAAMAAGSMEHVSVTSLAAKAKDSLKTSCVSLKSKSRSIYKSGSGALGGGPIDIMMTEPDDDAEAALEASESAGASLAELRNFPGAANSGTAGGLGLPIDRIGRTYPVASNRQSVCEPKPLLRSSIRSKDTTAGGAVLSLNGMATSSGSGLSRSRVAFADMAAADGTRPGSAGAIISGNSGGNGPEGSGGDGGARGLAPDGENVTVTRKLVRPKSAPTTRRPNGHNAHTTQNPNNLLSGKYVQTNKFNSFELKRMPGVDAMTDQLIDSQREQMEQMNRRFVLRLCNPWSALLNSDVLFKEAAWENLQKKLEIRAPRTPIERPCSAPPQMAGERIEEQLVKAQERLALLEPFRGPDRRAPKKALATNCSRALPPSVRLAHTKIGPLDPERTDRLSRPRSRVARVTPEQQLEAILLARRPKRLRPMDPATFARLTRPKVRAKPAWQVEPEKASTPAAGKRPAGKKADKSVSGPEITITEHEETGLIDIIEDDAVDVVQVTVYQGNVDDNGGEGFGAMVADEPVTERMVSSAVAHISAASDGQVAAPGVKVTTGSVPDFTGSGSALDRPSLKKTRSMVDHQMLEEINLPIRATSAPNLDQAATQAATSLGRNNDGSAKSSQKQLGSKPGSKAATVEALIASAAALNAQISKPVYAEPATAETVNQPPARSAPTSKPSSRVPSQVIQGSIHPSHQASKAGSRRPSATKLDPAAPSTVTKGASSHQIQQSNTGGEGPSASPGPDSRRLSMSKPELSIRASVTKPPLPLNAVSEPVGRLKFATFEGSIEDEARFATIRRREGRYCSGTWPGICPA